MANIVASYAAWILVTLWLKDRVKDYTVYTLFPLVIYMLPVVYNTITQNTTSRDYLTPAFCILASILLYMLLLLRKPGSSKIQLNLYLSVTIPLPLVIYLVYISMVS